MRVMFFSAVIVALAAGCAVTTVDGKRLRIGSDAFPDYVESVFRRQNEVATGLALAIEDEPSGTGRYAALEAAELELLTACRGLNELAEATRGGEDPRGLAALQRARVAPDCERATNRAVEELE